MSNPAVNGAGSATPRNGASSRVDGWANLLTGLGVQGRDKRLEGTFSADELTETDVEALYQGDDCAARIIESLPDEMTREGFELRIADDSDGASEAMMARIDELNVLQVLHQALCDARAYGGAGVLLGAIDGQALTSPLQLERSRGLNFLTPLTCYELQPMLYYDSVIEPRYGEPKAFDILQRPSSRVIPLTGKSETRIGVHESRILRFDGIRRSRRRAGSLGGWGDSVLRRAHQVLRDFNLSWASVSVLMSSVVQGVFSMKGLAELLASGREDVVIRRMQLIDYSRSVARGVLLDSEEKFTMEGTPLSGVPELLEKFALRLAAAARMPVSLLMGQAPAGLNATGDSDIRWWYDSARAAQEKVLRPALNTIIRMLFLERDGPTRGREPDNWTIEFRPLWQLTELEQAELRNKQAQTDGIYLVNQVLTPEEVAISRFGGDRYSTETVLDLDAREAQAELEEAQAEQPPPQPEASPPPPPPQPPPPTEPGQSRPSPPPLEPGEG